MLQKSPDLFESVGETIIVGSQGLDTKLEDWEKLFVYAESIAPDLLSLQELLEEKRVVSMLGLVIDDQTIANIKITTNFANQFISDLPQISPALLQALGFGERQHYIVIQQNNYELRPTGGYIGSFAEFWLENGALKDFHIDAIGVPNGQIKGYVQEPEPIRKYLHQGQTPGWSLRDSNWDPDFPESVVAMEWFFYEGGISDIDGFVAINLLPVIDMVEALGSINLSDYDEVVTADNFYEVTQRESSFNFFAGSTQKRNYFNHLVEQLGFRLEQASLPELLSMSAAVIKNLEEKQILLQHNNEQLTQYLRR